MGDWVAGFGGANTAISHKMVFLMSMKYVHLMSIGKIRDFW